MNNTGFDHNTNAGLYETAGAVTVADSYAHYNTTGFYATGGTLSLTDAEAVLNGSGIVAATSGTTVQLSSCLIAQNTGYALQILSSATISGTSHGTNTIIGTTSGSLSTPGHPEN